MKRYGQVIGIRPEHTEAYERLHKEVWPEVLATIHRCNIRNYSIFRYNDLLFSYFEYIGTDFDVDMARMAEDPKTQEWWAVCGPMQQSLRATEADDWWLTIPEVFHTD